MWQVLTNKFSSEYGVQNLPLSLGQGQVNFRGKVDNVEKECSPSPNYWLQIL